MYGAVLGKHKHISLKELELVQPTNITISQNIVLFDTKKPELLSKLAGIIKWGKCITKKDITPVDIIGTNERDFGKEVKKEGLTRRFKEVDPTKTDLEVKEKGKEYLVIEENIIAIEGYQDISLYEAIDFEKPVNSMKIGMMPAKLTHMMINMGMSQCHDDDDITVYDPFVGLGTTAFLVNYLGYDCIASDIDVTAMKQNTQRWQEQDLAQKEKRITVFKHDIFEPLKKPFLQHVNLIVTEGWL